jgi:hypothetical protein
MQGLIDAIGLGSFRLDAASVVAVLSAACGFFVKGLLFSTQLAGRLTAIETKLDLLMEDRIKKHGD